MLSLGLGLTRIGKDSADKLINGNFVDWADSSYPDGWTKGGTHDANNYVEESPANSLHFVSDGTFVSLIQTAALISGKAYGYEIVCSAAVANGIEFYTSSSFLTVNSATTYRGTFIADATTFGMKRSGATNVTISSVRVWEL